MNNIGIIYSIIAFLIILAIIRTYVGVKKLIKDNEDLWKKLLDERKKSFYYKKQIEVMNIFYKEIDLITKENHYNSVKNLENKLRSTLEDLPRRLPKQ